MTIIVLPFLSIEKIEVLPWDVQLTILQRYNFPNSGYGQGASLDISVPSVDSESLIAAD